MRSTQQRTAAATDEQRVPPLAPATRDGIRYALLATLTLALVVVCVFIALPFLPAITWAVALAIIAWPLHRQIRKRVGSPRWSAVASTAIVVVVVVAPIVLVAYHLTREVAAMSHSTETGAESPDVRAAIDSLPAVGSIARWMDQLGIDLQAEVGRLATSSMQDLAGLARGSLSAVVQFLIVIFLLYFIFADRAELLNGLRDLLPLTGPESQRVFERAAESVHANLYASVMTSLIDSAGGVLMFWVLGLPGPFLWGFVMFVLCLLPILGATMVWIPAALYLATTDRWPSALALTAWGVATSIVVDNILYARLVGTRTRIHEAPALIAFLGGLALFGVSGMILGPAIVAVTVAVLEVWKGRLELRSDDGISNARLLTGAKT